MKRGTKKPGSEIKLATELVLKPHPEVAQVLAAFSEKFMNNGNEADAAYVLLCTAICDYERTMATLGKVERYCNAEGFGNQLDFRLATIRRKFPKGRLPKVKV